MPPTMAPEVWLVGAALLAVVVSKRTDLRGREVGLRRAREERRADRVAVIVFMVAAV